MKKLINKTLLITLLIIFSYIFICSLFLQSNVLYKQNQFISLLFAIPVICIFYKLLQLNKFEKLKNLSFKRIVIYLSIYFIIVSLIQFVVLKYLSVNPGWDFGVLFNNASDYANTGTIQNSVYPGYFQYFPNNIMLFQIMVLFIKLGNILGINALFSCYIMNILFIDLALLLLFLVLKKKFNTATGFAGLIITFFFLPLFLYTPIFYSDTMSLFIPLMILLLYLNVDETNVKKNYTIFALLGFLLFLGVQLKLSSIFILIAVMVDYIMNHKQIFINICLMLLTFVMFNILFNSTVVNNPKYSFKYNNYGSYPFTHWIMMGVEDIDHDNSFRNSYGGYSEEDYNLSRKFEMGKDAIKFNILEYLNRVNKMGLIGYGEFLTKKSVNIWTDGYYFADIKLDLNPRNTDNALRNIIYNNSITKNLLINFTQGVQYSFILIMLFGIFKRIKYKSEQFDYLLLTIIGLFIFFLFWEARSRYLFNYIPIFIIVIIQSLVGDRYEEDNVIV